MDKGTFFLALIILVAAVGVGWGVWWYYTDVVPERSADEKAFEALLGEEGSEVFNVGTETQGATASAGTASAMVVKAFFGSTEVAPGEECSTVLPVLRRVPKTTSVARAALTELLAGVTADEEGKGYLTAIPSGVEIRNLKLENGVLHADFSGALDDGVAGSCRVSAIRKQIEETAKQFPTVTGAIISIEGVTDGILQP